MTIEKVLNVFSGYLKQNTAVEVVETARGHVVMIWDSRMKDWSDVYHCPTAKVLMNTLLNCKEVFDEECFTRGERDLTDDERVRVAQMRQEIICTELAHLLCYLSYHLGFHLFTDFFHRLTSFK